MHTRKVEATFTTVAVIAMVTMPIFTSLGTASGTRRAKSGPSQGRVARRDLQVAGKSAVAITGQNEAERQGFEPW